MSMSLLCSRLSLLPSTSSRTSLLLLRAHLSTIKRPSSSSQEQKEKKPEDNRKPRNAAIKYEMVRFVDPVTNELSEPTPMKALLKKYTSGESKKDRWKQVLELATETPYPIVKLVDTSAQYAKKKEQKAKTREASKVSEEKEVQFTWGIATKDFDHKLKKAREELMRGYRVNLVFVPRKGQGAISPVDMNARLDETIASLADHGKEWKERVVQGRTAVVYLQGERVSPS
ncbi:hypothetical protein C8Q75DRAFT_771999 [Abortiporus biennis]|nr:hypothetical protein C8Q75DRAFT_771999 [Abortiporus biennis]